MVVGLHREWEVVVTHLPTGLSASRTGRHFRNHHLARDSAMRYLRSRLYAMGLQAENIDREVSVTDLPGDTTCPNDLGEFRAFNNDRQAKTKAQARGAGNRERKTKTIQGVKASRGSRHLQGERAPCGHQGLC